MTNRYIVPLGQDLEFEVIKGLKVKLKYYLATDNVWQTLIYSMDKMGAGSLAAYNLRTGRSSLNTFSLGGKNLGGWYEFQLVEANPQQIEVEYKGHRKPRAAL